MNLNSVPRAPSMWCHVCCAVVSTQLNASSRQCAVGLRETLSAKSICSAVDCMPEPVERTMQCRRMQLNESPSNSTPSNSTPSKLSKTTLCRPRCRRLRPHSGRRSLQRRACRIPCCRTPDRLSRSDTSSAASATTEILPAFAVDDVNLTEVWPLALGLR